MKFKAAYIYQSQLPLRRRRQALRRAHRALARERLRAQGRRLRSSTRTTSARTTPRSRSGRARSPPKKALMSDAKFAKAVARFMEGSTFKNTDAMRDDCSKRCQTATPEAEAKAAVMAALKYDAFLKEFPKSEFAPLAVYNVQLLYANEEVHRRGHRLGRAHLEGVQQGAARRTPTSRRRTPSSRRTRRWPRTTTRSRSIRRRPSGT